MLWNRPRTLQGTSFALLVVCLHGTVVGRLAWASFYPTNPLEFTPAWTQSGTYDIYTNSPTHILALFFFSLSHLNFRWPEIAIVCSLFCTPFCSYDYSEPVAADNHSHSLTESYILDNCLFKKQQYSTCTYLIPS